MSNFLQRSKLTNKGFTVPELLVYIGIMTLALVSVVTLLVNSSKILQAIKTEKEVRVSAIAAMERMTREVKGSEAVILPESSFGVDDGELAVFSRLVEDSPRRVNFLINDQGELEIQYDGEPAGVLTSPGVVVDRLRFSHLAHGESESVRIELVLHPEDRPSKEITFYSTAVLRGLY